MSKRPPLRRKVMVVTGSRSEFGLLRPVMEAVRKNRKLALQVVVAGEHLLAPASTWREVEKAFGIDARVPMQKKGDKGRADHAAACGRGVEGFSKVIKRLKPDWVVVLGDRIEAFAAASAASIAGVAVCHIHGGDRAEGIADEAMRHAITKLSHLHCAATKLSAERIIKMGEPAGQVYVTGSPSIDGLREMSRTSSRVGRKLARVATVILLHPSGMGASYERVMAGSIVHAVDESAPGDVLALAPNHDPGRAVIDEIWQARRITPEARVGYGNSGKGSTFKALSRDNEVSKARINGRVWHYRAHLPREEFLGLLRRMARSGDALMIGNSSAGLIEAAALGISVVNVGPRQAGRERAGWCVDVPEPDTLAMMNAISGLRELEFGRRVLKQGPRVPAHPYGDGRAGPRIAALLARTDPHDPALLRKRIAY